MGLNIKEHISRIDPRNPNGYHWRQPKHLNVAILEPEEPLHREFAAGLAGAFSNKGDCVLSMSNILGNKEAKLPGDVDMVVAFDKASGERRPNALLGKFPKDGERPRSEKKVVVVTDDNGLEPDLYEATRTIMGRKAGHIAVVHNSNPDSGELSNHASVALGTMEGSVDKYTYETEDPQRLYGLLAQTLAFLASADMVSGKEGKEKKGVVSFREWVRRPEVQGVRTASHTLAEAGLLKETDLGKYASKAQISAILKILNKGGLGEGMLSTVVKLKKQPVMAVSASGENKTDMDPAKGQVPAVPEIKPNNVVYLIQKGFPKGHPINLFTHPASVWEQFRNSYLRGELKRLAKVFLTGRVEMKREPSIEAYENFVFYIAASLLQAGKVTNLRNLLTYLDEKFRSSLDGTISLDINGANDYVVNAVAHIHKIAKVNQKNKKVKIVDVPLEELGFPHSAPCGSREALIHLLVSLYKSYEEYGPMDDPDEIRGANLGKHGMVFWGRNGIVALAKNIVDYKVDYEDDMVRVAVHAGPKEPTSTRSRAVVMPPIIPA